MYIYEYEQLAKEHEYVATWKDLVIVLVCIAIALIAGQIAS